MAYEPTIFENHRTFVKNLTSGDTISVDLWDTAGQEEYERLRRLSYQDADVVIVAYSNDAPESLPNIHEVWAPEVMTYAPEASIILVGLKSDMDIKIDLNYAYNIADSIGAVTHMACSSIKMENVNELFNCVFNTAYNKAMLKQHHEMMQKQKLNNPNNYTNQNSKHTDATTDTRTNTKSKSKRNSLSSMKIKKKTKCVIL